MRRFYHSVDEDDSPYWLIIKPCLTSKYAYCCSEFGGLCGGRIDYLGTNKFRMMYSLENDSYYHYDSPEFDQMIEHMNVIANDQVKDGFGEFDMEHSKLYNIYVELYDSY